MVDCFRFGVVPPELLLKDTLSLFQMFDSQIDLALRQSNIAKQTVAFGYCKGCTSKRTAFGSQQTFEEADSRLVPL